MRNEAKRKNADDNGATAVNIGEENRATYEGTRTLTDETYQPEIVRLLLGRNKVRMQASEPYEVL